MISRKSLSIILPIIFGSMAVGFRTENSAVALITKTVQDVTMRSSPNDWKKAGKGEPLISGDQVRTGQKSLAIVKFVDKSIVRVREESELTVEGESTEPGKISKTIRLVSGAIGFDVQKQQQNEKFRFTSPTSVASIRGTQGKLSAGLGNDTLVVVEGLVNLLNTMSNKDIDVAAGSIGFSNQDGTISSRKATPQEITDAASAARGGSSNELNLELRDSKGNKKELKLKYKK